MAVSRHPIIAKEGWSLILFSSFVVIALQHYVSPYLAVLWCAPAILLWFYRDPHRPLPSDPLGLVSPVNGTVTLAEAHPDPFLGRDAFLFRISISLTDIFSIRSVTEGKIIQQWLDPEDDDDDRSLAHAIQVKTDENDDVMIVLDLGAFLNNSVVMRLLVNVLDRGIAAGLFLLVHVLMFISLLIAELKQILVTTLRRGQLV